MTNENGNFDELVVGVEQVETVTPKFNTSRQTSDSGDSGEDPSDH